MPLPDVHHCTGHEENIPNLFFFEGRGNSLENIFGGSTSIIFIQTPGILIQDTTETVEEVIVHAEQKQSPQHPGTELYCELSHITVH